jgi:hypothetical protein
MKYKITITVDTKTLEAVQEFTNVLNNEILRDLESLEIFTNSNAIYYKVDKK